MIFGISCASYGTVTQCSVDPRCAVPTVDLHGRSTRCIQHDMAGTVDLRYATVYYCVLRGTTVETPVVSPLCRVQL